MSSTPGGAKPSSLLVRALFLSTVFLSIVSWYTTYQGMALYLTPWFAFLASFGVQSALVLVAWLTGSTQDRKPLLVSVYIVTALVSVAFSYVSLYTWFSSKERPAIVQRQLYDTLMASSGKTSELLTGAVAEAEKHVLALEEMARSEKTLGYAAKVSDVDPYLGRIREAVAREAQSGYREGAGEGVRFAAFERHTKLERQTLDQLQHARRSVDDFRAQLKPNDSSEQQIRRFRTVYDAVPWTEVERELGRQDRLVRPEVPALADNLDKTSTGQEELLLAFTELIGAPTGRHLFAFLLAAFIDVIVFLLAFSAGPHLGGPPEYRWRDAAAAVDGANQHVFARDLLRKFEPDAEGKPRVAVDGLTPGERQFLFMLAGEGRAFLHGGYYLLDHETHGQLMESLASARRQLPLRVSPPAAHTTV